jgi:ribosomal protein S18 acetylase RimI-like enzyme
MEFNFREIDKKNIDEIRGLWQKTKDYHSSISVYFSEEIAGFTFEGRMKEIFAKADKGRIKIYIAEDPENKKPAGFAISIINLYNEGEIESIYVEPEYRNLGIARRMILKTLDWMNENSVKTKKLFVAVGNECVIDFYKKLGFYPNQLMMKEKK